MSEEQLLLGNYDDLEKLGRYVKGALPNHAYTVFMDTFVFRAAAYNDVRDHPWLASKFDFIDPRLLAVVQVPPPRRGSGPVLSVEEFPMESTAGPPTKRPKHTMNLDPPANVVPSLVPIRPTARD